MPRRAPRLAVFPLLVHLAAGAAHAQAPRAEPTRLPCLPHAIASFGAARAGDHVYVFGGHVGRAHVHTTENTVGTFLRLRVPTGREWEVLAEGPPLQGTALAAGPDGSVYRIGGMRAHNRPGDPEDMHSTASVQRYEPATNTWSDCTPLPEARSSHDAVVLGDVLYVAGGWQLAGGGEGTWLSTAWRADLTRQPLVWEPLPAPPFQRRACAAAAFGGHIAVLGGIEGRKPSRAVALYDPATATWSPGPDLPASGFGCAALGVASTLYASLMDGSVLRLDAGAARWLPCDALAVPRLFHRLVAVDSAGHDVGLVLGGATRAGHLPHVELVALAADRRAPIQEWVVAFPGAARTRLGVRLQDDTLHLFGGNGGGRDRFAASSLSAQTWRLDLGCLSLAPGPDLPAPRQSMAVLALDGERSLLLGGLGTGDDPATQAVSRADGVEVAGDAADTFAAAMPEPRTQFGAVAHDGKVWVFGGIDFRPDGSGGGEASLPTEVLVCDLATEPRTFVRTGIHLPSPRRSFGGVALGAKYYLIGGLGEDFTPVARCDVFDFATRQWSTAPQPPKVWVSPQVCALGSRVFLACGGTMSGMEFTEDRALVEFAPERGWSTVVEALPFPVRGAHMLAWRGRLLFASIDGGEGSPQVTLRALVPPAVAVVQAVEAVHGR